MLNQDEAGLIRRSQQGDQEAFVCLVERYHDRIINYAYSMTRNRDDAYGVAQDAFFRAWNQIRSFNGESSFSTWLTRITRDIFLDIRKKREHDPRISLDDLMDSP